MDVNSLMNEVAMSMLVLFIAGMVVGIGGWHLVAWIVHHVHIQWTS